MNAVPLPLIEWALLPLTASLMPIGLLILAVLAIRDRSQR